MEAGDLNSEHVRPWSTWRMLQELEQRLGFDQKASAAALITAAARGWIMVDRAAETGWPWR